MWAAITGYRIPIVQNIDQKIRFWVGFPEKLARYYVIVVGVPVNLPSILRIHELEGVVVFFCSKPPRSWGGLLQNVIGDLLVEAAMNVSIRLETAFHFLVSTDFLEMLLEKLLRSCAARNRFPFLFLKVTAK